MANGSEKEIQEHDKTRLDYFSHSVGKSVVSAFDSVFSVVLRHVKTQGRSRKLVIPGNSVPLNLNIKPGTMSLTIQAIGTYLDGVTLTVGDGFSYTYRSGSQTTFDTINLPTPGTEVYLNSSIGMQVSVVESPFPHSSPIEDRSLINQVVLTGSNATEGNYTLTWAASAASGTAETVSVPLPSPYQGDALYLVSVQNPSALGTSVTLNFQNAINFGAGDQWSTITSVDVVSGATQSYLIQGWLLGDGAAQISGTNDQTASSTGGTVLVQVRKV